MNSIMRRLKVRALRWLNLVEPCGMHSESHLDPDDRCILCENREWVPTRSMLQAMFRAMAPDARRHVDAYDAWNAAQQIVDMALGDLERTAAIRPGAAQAVTPVRPARDLTHIMYPGKTQ